MRANHLTLLGIALLLVNSACNRSAQPDASAPPAPDESKALVGQWRNMDGTWRFQADGIFWFMGGTTIQANPSGLSVPKTESLSGT